jgi:hypothetical protein
VDQRLFGCRTRARLVLALVLLGTGTWLVSVIQAALWLRVPGAYGPVQYWDNAPGGGLDFMGVRALALFLTCGGFLVAVATPIAAIAALFVESPVSRWRRCIIPAVALAVYIAAYQMFFAYGFYPSA